ncbi:MAG: DUF368 domain-containing protein [Flavobacteriaceae bacterium]|nr:DUF368 domain-containing protein [Flavobacteriaceae bacterium]
MKSITLILKGVFMGIADLVPGVSGGTIALILGIYDEFIFSLSKLSFSSLKKLKNEGITVFWSEINGNFLLKLFSGILIGVSFFTYLIDWLINNYPIPLWAFFIGILLSSTGFIYKKIKLPNVKLLLYLFLGILISFVITQINPSSENKSISGLYLFFSSLIAISAMILPGISGAYILILFGTYSEVISTIKGGINIILQQDYTNVYSVLFKTSIIGFGIICGILIFSKFFKWLLIKFYDKTLVFLIGLMLGGLNKIWPWQENGENLLPFNYSGEKYLLASLIFFILGTLFVFGVQFIEKRKYNDKKENK